MCEDIAKELRDYSRWAMRKCQAFDAGEIGDDELPFFTGDTCAMLDKAYEEIRDLRSKLAAVRRAVEVDK